MASTKKYKDYLEQLDGNDIESKNLIEQNKAKENTIIEQYKKVADASSNAYKDSVAAVDRQRSQAMQDANALTERLARYIPEINQRAGIAGTGMSESVALEAYAAQDAQRRDIATAYDTQKNSLMQEYAKAAAEREAEKQALLSEIELSNIAAVNSAKNTKLSAQKTNLSALGEGVKDGSVALQDYLDYYNKMSGSLDEDKDMALIQQYKEVLLDNVKKKDRKDGKVFNYNGKYYKVVNGAVYETTAENYEESIYEEDIPNKMGEKFTSLAEGDIFVYEGKMYKKANGRAVIIDDSTVRIGG